MADFPDDPVPDGDDLPAEASQLADHFDSRDRQLAEREQQLADARAAFRRERDAERERLAADRAEAARLRREAEALHRETARTRDRTKRLAFRYAKRVRQKWADVKAGLEARSAATDEARGRLSAEVARFEVARSEFHTTVAEEKDRLREAWEALDAHRQRSAAERTEANEFFARQETALAARTAEVAQREAALAAARAKLEKETTGLRQEAGGLEARVQNARAAVGELERQRDQLRAEMLAALPPPSAEPPGELQVALDRRADRDLTQWAAELDAESRQLAQERSNLTTLKAALERDAVELADQRRVLAEQFVMLGAARAEWQDAERRTVTEMEELARGLRVREEDLVAREERLVRADARRREEAHDLWRHRLRLEAWQSKLLAVSRVWHAEREKRDEEYARRAQALADRQATLHAIAGRWERARVDECERVRAELQAWADDRAKLVRAAGEYDRRAAEVLGELATHAARATAAEELLAGEKGATRRFEVLRKRWDRVFRRKLDEIEQKRAAAAAELARVDERYQELHRALAGVAEREAELNTRAARLDEAALNQPGVPASAGEPIESPSAEIATLRDEFERMAAVLIEAGVPEPPDEQLPWAAEEPDPEAADVLPFAPHAHAA